MVDRDAMARSSSSVTPLPGLPTPGASGGGRPVWAGSGTGLARIACHAPNPCERRQLCSTSDRVRHDTPSGSQPPAWPLPQPRQNPADARLDGPKAPVPAQRAAILPSNVRHNTRLSPCSLLRSRHDHSGGISPWLNHKVRAPDPREGQAKRRPCSAVRFFDFPETWEGPAPLARKRVVEYVL